MARDLDESQKGDGCFNCASALEVIDLNHSDRSLMTSWKLKRTAQCAHCPWRVEVDPHDIPHGYCESKHQALAATIAEPGTLPVAGAALRVMVCHETDEAHCIGWLNHQLGPGNNLALRLRMMSCENRDKLRLRGEQHPSFETTLPRASVDPA
ncbi:DUF6283 family protein [Variovorax sp. PvP013]|jgi:hypothetical protein|uniref:DUF6283 family protein n=1 Tax=Variovorax sp. PvP013 TaxID=3156435 RepID=UPI003D1BEC59